MSVHHHKLPIVTDGLVFQVDAANDLGGNVTNVKNIVDPVQVGSLMNSLAVVNGSFDFDGVDDYIDFGYLTSLDLISYTVSLWYKSNVGVGSGGFIVDKRILGNTDAQNVNFAIACRSAAVNAFYANGTFRETPIGGVFDTKLNNLVSSFDGTNLKIHLNGILMNTTASGGLLPSVTGSQNLYLGRSGNGVGDRYLNGQLSNCKIYNRALTAAEIEQNYEATKHKFE